MDHVELPEFLAEKYSANRFVVSDGISDICEASNLRTKRVVFLRIWSLPFTKERERTLERMVRGAVSAKEDHFLDILDLEPDPQESRLPVLVLEPARGQSVSEILADHGPLRPGLACRMAREVASAIQTAREWGVAPIEPIPERVFLAQFAGTKDFAKVVVPNRLDSARDGESQADSVALGKLLWKALTDMDLPDPLDEDVLERILQDLGVPGDKAQILARLVADATSGQADVDEIASRIDLAGLAESPSTDRSLSFDTRVPVSVEEEEAEESLDETVLDRLPSRLTPKSQPQFHTISRIMIGKTTMLWMVGLLGFMLGALVSGLGTFLLLTGRERSAAHRVDKGQESRHEPNTATAAAMNTSNAIRFAVAYYSPSAVVQREMSKLANYLTQALGQQVVLVDIPHDEVAPRMAQGWLHIAVFSPYLYVLTKAEFDARGRRPPFKLIVSHLTDGNLTYQGFLLVRAESPIVTLEQVRGKTLCFVSPRSTSGYLYPMALLKSHGIDPMKECTIRYSRTHEQALADLAAGRCQVAAVGSVAYFRTGQQYSLRLLAVTPRIPGDAYCVSTTLSTKEIERIREAFLRFRPRQFLGRPYLGKLHRITGFQEVDDSHYDSIRRVHETLFGPLTAGAFGKKGHKQSRIRSLEARVGKVPIGTGVPSSRRKPRGLPGTR